MKANKKMTMPSNYTVLSEEEMLQNESGWYLNLTEKKVLLLPNEVAKGGFIVDFLLRKIGLDSATVDINSFFNTENDEGEARNGVCVQVADNSFSLSFHLSDSDLELAGSNKIAW